MDQVARAALLSLPLMVAGCGDSSESDESGPYGPGGPVGKAATCELVSMTELADANELAPNGKTGAQILAAVPASLHTSLEWDVSTPGLGIEVEVPGAIGLGTGLDLTFSVPEHPRFFFVDRVTVEPPGDIHLDLEVVCPDYVTTTLDVTLVSEDGTIAAELTGLTVWLGPDDSLSNEVAVPFVYESAAMSTPAVNFLAPEALPASDDKIISLWFDGSPLVGSITVQADGSDETYQQIVARW